MLTTEPGHRAEDGKAGKLLRANSKAILQDSDAVALWPPRVTSGHLWPTISVFPQVPDSGHSLLLMVLSLEITDGRRADILPTVSPQGPWTIALC